MRCVDHAILGVWVPKQCPAVPSVWGHRPQRSMAALAPEDGVYTTVRHVATRTAQFEKVKYGVRNAECGLGGACVAPQGDQLVSCHPWGVGALPPMPHGGPSC